MIGILNADMFGTPSEPGEHVDWSSPDIVSRADFLDMLGGTPEEMAPDMPWMIFFEVTP